MKDNYDEISDLKFILIAIGVTLAGILVGIASCIAIDVFLLK